MKQQLRFLFLLVVLMSLSIIKAHAYDAEIDGIFYNFNGDEAEVTFEVTTVSKTYIGNVIIPETVNYNGKSYRVTTIGQRAFYYERELSTVVIPESVTSIGEEAFSNCHAMTSVSIPNSVKTIGKSAFAACSSLNSIKIPDSVTSIEERTFYNSALISINIPSSVTSIGEYAFGQCNELTTIEIPHSVITIGDCLFSNCKKLKSCVIGNSAKSISNSMFIGCSNLENVTIGSSVETIGRSAFYNCSNLKTIIIPNSVKTIGSSAFDQCSELASITIGKGVTTIEDYAFHRYLTKLETVNIEDVAAWCNISFGYEANPLKHAHNLLLNGKKIESLVIPNTVTEIKGNAFPNCNFRSVVIPNSVTSIGSKAFSNCTIQSLTIGSGVVSMEYDAFPTKASWEPAPIIKTIWLTNTPPKGYQKAAGIINYVSNDQYMITDKDKLTFVYPMLTSIFAVDGIKYVPTSMTERTCEAIDAVYDESAMLTKLGPTVTYRGVTLKVDCVNPFTCCGNTYIKKVELTDLPYIDDHVFDGCTNLESAKLPETIAGLGISSFQDCESLQEMTIPAATQLVMYNTFKGCKSLKNVIMDDGPGVLSLAYNADVTIDYKNNKVSISGDSKPLFDDCPLDYVYIGRNISYGTMLREGYSPFYRNTSLRTVKITDQETEISENEFYGCSGLKNVWIGNGVTTIGNWAFSGCSSLDYFEFGSSMQTIGDEAFSDCSAVTNLISHAATPPVCGSQALLDISVWDCTLIVPDGYIGAYEVAPQWKEFLFKAEISTDVHSITDMQANTPSIHSLSGQRLDAPRKGVNIINGKKVVIK